MRFVDREGRSVRARAAALDAPCDACLLEAGSEGHVVIRNVAGDAAATQTLRVRMTDAEGRTSRFLVTLMK